MASTMRTFLFVLVIVPLVITGFVFMLNQLAADYGFSVEGQYADVYGDVNASIQTNYDNSQELQSQLTGEDFSSEAGEAGFQINLFKAVLVPFQNLSVITKIITNTAAVLQVPEWIVYSLLSIIFILLAALALSIGFRTTV